MVLYPTQTQRHVIKVHRYPTYSDALKKLVFPENYYKLNSLSPSAITVPTTEFTIPNKLSSNMRPYLDNKM